MTNGRFGAAYTKGLQTNSADTSKLQVAVTLKHWDAYSLENSDGFTRHNFNAIVDNYTIADTFWPAFADAVLVGKARGVMCSYNALNGVPTCANPLLNHQLRTVWGFEGYVSSDTGAVSDIYKEHKYTKDASSAACTALKDGKCDIDSGAVYHEALLDGVKAGHCSMDDVDAGLFNTLKLRFEMGLFDPPQQQPLWRVPTSAINSADHIAASKLATLESMVLLKNEAETLPFKPGASVAVIGPHAKAQGALVGNYLGQICPSDTFDCVQTPFEAITTVNTGGKTTFAAGCSDGVKCNDSDGSGIASAVAAAKAADRVVLLLGIDGSIEGESHDRTDLTLPGQQSALAKAVLAVGRPTVIVLINGGMVAVANETLAAPAVLEAFYPGLYGAEAIAATLFGLNENLGGKMPYTTYPADYIDQVKMSDMSMTAGPGRSYRYYTGQALWPFGYGISLTTFKISNTTTVSSTTTTTAAAAAAAAIESSAADRQAGVMMSIEAAARTHNASSEKSKPLATYSVTVTNTGKATGDEVVFAYVRPSAAILTRAGAAASGDAQAQDQAHPLIKSLADYKRVHLAPGASTTVTLAVRAREMALGDILSGDRCLYAGEYDIVFTNGVNETHIERLTLTSEEESVDKIVVTPFPRV